MKETKLCPYCGKEILAVAKKCRHCGEWLEKKESEKEKKVCPICGEAIDSRLMVCPNCGEPTHFLDAQTDSDTAERAGKRDEGVYLYCKCCKTRLHIDSDSCSKCGDRDPFYFKRIKRFEIISGGGACILILGILYFASEYMGLRLNITPEWLEFVCYMVIFFILTGIFTVLIRRLLFQSYIRDYENIMYRILNEIGHSEAIKHWKAKVQKILDD